MKTSMKPLLSIATALLLLLSGCAHPDRWGVFANIPLSESLQPPETPQDPDPPQPQKAEPVIPHDGTVDLSVEEAVMLALTNNHDLQAHQLGPVIAGTFEKIERGIFDPELFVEAGYSRERAVETSRSSETAFSVQADSTRKAAGIRQRLPFGTTIEAAVEHERTSSNRTPEQNRARLGLSITQALLQGGGPAVNLASVRQAELETLASLYELRGFTEALLAETETAYWNYVLAKKEIVIFERSLEVALKQCEEVELRIEVGILPEIEAAAARAEVARREQALIDAQSQLEERRLRLLKLISSDAESNCMINSTSEADVEPTPITDLSDRLKLAGLMRPDLGEARLRLEQNRLETIVTRNGLLPKLDLFAALGRTGFADSFSGSFRALKGNTFDFTAGFSLSRFIGNRSAEGRHLAAQATRQQAEKALANLKEIVSLEVRLAVNETERSRRQIAASRTTRLLQEETAKAEKERFDVGSSTSLLVAQAQRDLLASRIAEIEAVVNYRVALIELYRAEGSLLERRGITLSTPLAKRE